MSAADELFEDIRIIHENLEALHKEVAELSKRTQEQGKHLGRAELDEVLAKVKEETRFQVHIPYKDVMDNFQQHLTTPAKLEVVLLSGLRQIKQIIDQIPRSVRVESKVWGFTDRRVGVLSVGTPLVLLLLLLWFPGVFSRVPKADFDELKAQYEDNERQLTTFRSMRAKLFKQDSLLAYRYFPYKGDPRPPFISKPNSPVPKKKRSKHR